MTFVWEVGADSEMGEELIGTFSFTGNILFPKLVVNIWKSLYWVFFLTN